MEQLLLHVPIPEMSDVFMRYWRAFVLLVPKLIMGVLAIAVAIFLAMQVARLLNTKLKKRAPDPLLVSFIAQIAKWVIILSGITLGLSIIGFSNIVGGLIAGASVSALVIGFAFKDIGENFLAGIILAFNRPFHVNDTIGIDNNMGQVVGMGIRSTRIKTADGRDVYIPNATLIKSTLTNFTADGNIRLDFKLLLSLTTNVEGASDTVLQAVKQVPGVLEFEGPFCTLEEFTNKAAVLRVYFWMHTFDYRTETLAVKTRAMDATLKALQHANFEVVGLPKAQA